MTVRNPATLRVATMNCLHGMDVRAGPPPPVDAASMERLAGCLEMLDADIIALQEVDRRLARSSGIDQVEWLAGRLSMTGHFTPALLGNPDSRWVPLRGDDPGGGAYGVALLSRHPISRLRRLRLPGGLGRRAGGGVKSRISVGSAGHRPGWDYEPRVALRADIATPHGCLAVTTTHLSYLPWRSLHQLVRAAQLAEDEDAAILIGDLNLPAWVVRHALHGWAHGGGGPTYPASDPRVQLDHILTNGRIRVLDARAVGPMTSDHRPIVATVRMLESERA